MPEAVVPALRAQRLRLWLGPAWFGTPTVPLPRGSKGRHNRDATVQQPRGE